MSEYTEKHYNFPPIEAGASFNWSVSMKDDAGVILTGLTGATLSCIVKSYPGGPTLQDLSAKFVLTVATALINFDLTPADTAAMKWTKGVYKLKLTMASGAVKYLLYGEMTVDLG